MRYIIDIRDLHLVQTGIFQFNATNNISPTALANLIDVKNNIMAAASEATIRLTIANPAIGDTDIASSKIKYASISAKGFKKIVGRACFKSDSLNDGTSTFYID
jgi:NRPS condensation-like uncharacterized protein